MALIDDLTADLKEKFDSYEEDAPSSEKFATDLATVLVTYLIAEDISGSFTSDDGKTIEVTNGVITGIS